MSKDFSDRRSCMGRTYHPVRTKLEVLRESSEWYRQQREKEIFLRLAAVLVFAFFAFLVLD